MLISAQESIQVFPLWEHEIPGTIENSTYNEEKFAEDTVVSKIKYVSKPSITIFRPNQPNGSAVVIFPGGGYQHLSIKKEGYEIAKWLNTLGITAFVVKYRLPSNIIMTNKTIGPLQDAQEALRFVRRKAKQWKLQDDKIGVIGFSAGGHLAATLSTQYDKKVYKQTDLVSAKPNFSILVYPVISMYDSIAHQGSKQNLLGKNPSKETISLFSNETQVNKFTPKTLLIHASDDKSVPVENSIYYYQSLNKNEVSATLYICDSGGHGFGLGRNNSPHFWTILAEEWLRANIISLE
jgi:acetyl esterase/lipase